MLLLSCASISKDNANRKYNCYFLLLEHDARRPHHKSAPCYCDQKYMVTRSSRFVILNLTFVTEGCHSLLWSGDTMFERSQIGYFRTKAVTVCYGQRPQDLKSHRTGTLWSTQSRCLARIIVSISETSCIIVAYQRSIF